MSEETDRRSLYQAVSMVQAWHGVMADLILFACSATDPMVRCGRLDVIAYIEDSIIGTPPVEEK